MKVLKSILPLALLLASAAAITTAAQAQFGGLGG